MGQGDDDNVRRSSARRSGKLLSPHYRGNDEGGYGNPPVSKQFAENNSGGPGRPAGKSNLESALRKILNKKLTVNKNGKQVKMPPAEVFAERALETILSKTRSPAMLEYGRKLLEQYGPSDTAEPRQFDLSTFSREEKEIVLGIINRALGQDPRLPERSASQDVTGRYKIQRRSDGHIFFERNEDGNNPE